MDLLLELYPRDCAPLKRSPEQVTLLTTYGGRPHAKVASRRDAGHAVDLRLHLGRPSMAVDLTLK
ncbi:hypothetical protein E2C01_092596 [Portunus trituberculatus]|uniref:Uncharacterized protein n=1 Tax=Portunus trituberculatus TaxID=210409 RepID=A0A5B7JGV3_PORTR|nr:hypothetical protein [Portunus trituberculatus]